MSKNCHSVLKVVFGTAVGECSANSIIMKKDVTKELADAASYINLIGGGSTMPKWVWKKSEQEYNLFIEVPGVDPENFGIDIVNRALLIFQRFERYDMPVPNLIHQAEIPFDVDVSEISATRTDRQLKISLPFNEMAGGYQRHVDIEPEY